MAVNYFPKRGNKRNLVFVFNLWADRFWVETCIVSNICQLMILIDVEEMHASYVAVSDRILVITATLGEY